MMPSRGSAIPARSKARGEYLFVAETEGQYRDPWEVYQEHIEQPEVTIVHLLALSG